MKYRHCWIFLLSIVMFVGLGAASAQQRQQVVPVLPYGPVLEFDAFASTINSPKPSISISTAEDPEGLINQMEVQTKHPSGSAYWAVFALFNPTDQPVERILVVPYYSLSGSGLLGPKLDERKIREISVNEGAPPERLDSTTSDLYRILIYPGGRVTHIVELNSLDIKGARLMTRSDYEAERYSFTFYQGIILGIAGLIALFLMVMSIIRGTLIFPAATGFAWAVLGYLLIDFDILPEFLQLSPSGIASYRAGAEALLGATLLLFLFAYLNLTRWYVQLSHLGLTWVGLMIGVVMLSYFESQLAAGIARFSLMVTAVIGVLAVFILVIRGFERAIMLLPTWIIYLAWMVGTGGVISGDIVSPFATTALSGGLVLIVLLLGFTVLQQAFSHPPSSLGLVSDHERRALALMGGGGLVWDWDVQRDNLFTSSNLESGLGLKAGTLNAPILVWMNHLHPADRDLLRASLEAVIDRSQGRVNIDFRVRDYYKYYRWYRLIARPLVGADGVCLRCIGTLTDVSDQYLINERLLQDAVYDRLTSLPNHALFNDRVQQAIESASRSHDRSPHLIAIQYHIDQKNVKVDRKTNDNIAVALASRLRRILQQGDTLCRSGETKFFCLGLHSSDPTAIARKSEELREAFREPVELNDQLHALKCSIGIAVHDGNSTNASEFVGNAEIALESAKQLGVGRIEIYSKNQRVVVPELQSLEDELTQVLEKDELTIVYQPIMKLADNKMVALETRAQWKSEDYGTLDLNELIGETENNQSLKEISMNVVHRIFEAAAKPSPDVKGLPLHFSLTNDHLFEEDIAKEIKSLAGKSGTKPERVCLTFDEAVLVRMPETAIHMINHYAELGLGIAIQNFGRGLTMLEMFERCHIDFVYHYPRASLEQYHDSELLKSIVQIAEVAGVSLIVNRVNSEEAIAAALGLGIEFGQGSQYATGTLGVAPTSGKTRAKRKQ